jgi:excisionase family DNA binding protein
MRQVEKAWRMNYAKDSSPLDRATDGLLNKWEVAAKLRIGKRTVDHWMRQGRLPFIKLGKTVRFRWPDVLEKLSAYRVN